MSYTDTITGLKKEFAHLAGCHVDGVQWWSWPQEFAGTAGPMGLNIVQKPSAYQVYAFKGSNGRKMKCCFGVWKGWGGVVGERW